MKRTGMNPYAKRSGLYLIFPSAYVLMDLFINRYKILNWWKYTSFKKKQYFYSKIIQLIKLSIIIVNYNVQYFLEQCLLSVQEASKNLITEIIVVDNNSTDESCAMIHWKFPKVNLITNKKNIGFSKANNQGVEMAKGEFILILNPDTLLEENTL